MKKREISHLLYAILTLIVILYCGIFVSESVADNKNIKNITSALESGDVKLIVEGIENGEKLKIKAEKKKSSSLVLVIPKGNTELKLGMFQTSTINMHRRKFKLISQMRPPAKRKFHNQGNIDLLRGPLR